jgi:hypothetical protein
MMTTIGMMTQDRDRTLARPVQTRSIYVMNKLNFYLVNDPREKALRDAVYRAIARLSKASRVFPRLAGALKRP